MIIIFHLKTKTLANKAVNRFKFKMFNHRQIVLNQVGKISVKLRNWFHLLLWKEELESILNWVVLVKIRKIRWLWAHMIKLI